MEPEIRPLLVALLTYIDTHNLASIAPDKIGMINIDLAAYAVKEELNEYIDARVENRLNELLVNTRMVLRSVGAID